MGVAVALPQDVINNVKRSTMVKYLGRNMRLIVPNEKMKKETSNDFVTTRLMGKDSSANLRTPNP